MLATRTFRELIQADLPALDMILTPWLPVEGLAMIVGYRGVGKTMISLACALAIGSGTGLLGWAALEQRKVLYCDGEMSLSQMKQRVQELVNGQPEFAKGLDNVTMLSHADQPMGIPNLIMYKKTRVEIEELMEKNDIEVLFLDNLSTLCNSSDENDAASWVVMQEWLIHLRRRGYSVVFLHHSGKIDDKGMIKQRGSSKREDALNTTILLIGDGAGGFLIHYDKARGFEPPDNHRAQLLFSPGKCMILEKKVQKPDMKRISKELG